MKIIKKIAAIMLSVMMVLGMCSVVGAVETSGTSETVKGKITIRDAVPEQTYTIYKILDLESYDATDPDNAHYAYKVATKWSDFFKKGAKGADYVTVDDAGYVTWKTGADVAAFAKEALVYAKDNSVVNEGSKSCVPKASTVEFESLDLGYYLVDSTTGTLCSINTTNNEVTIKEKNVAPTVEKMVQEDSTNSYGASNTADIGDTVNFKTTITAQAGAQNYVLHDKMDAGLTFKDSSVKIQWTKNSDNTKKLLVSGTDYNVTTTDLETTDPKCTFHVTFTPVFCDKLAKDDTIVITYSATLNEKSNVGTIGNKNETWLKYGESNNLETAHKETTTKTFEIPVFKYTMKNTTKTALKDATFKLSTDPEGNTVIKLKQKDSTTNYFVDSAGKESVTTNDTGKFTIKGLAAGTYYLTETKQPDGYNKLKEAIKIVIAGEDGTIKYGSKSKSDTELNQMSADGAVEVENKTGSLLPSTGGMGTTLFYIFGAILVVGSGVVLITKKRMK